MKLMKKFIKFVMCMMTPLHVLHLGMKFWSILLLVISLKPKTSKNDHLEQEEISYIQECDTSDEDSLITNVDGNDDYWTFIEIQYMRLLKILLRIPSTTCPEKGVWILRLWGILVWKVNVQIFHMIIQSCVIQNCTQVSVIKTWIKSTMKIYIGCN